VRERAAAPVAQPARSTLGAESALLSQALAALRTGDREAGRAALALHARLFPDGALAREREAALRQLSSE
jgi:hypothetical protein